MKKTITFIFSMNKLFFVISLIIALILILFIFSLNKSKKIYTIPLKSKKNSKEYIFKIEQNYKDQYIIKSIEEER